MSKAYEIAIFFICLRILITFQFSCKFPETTMSPEKRINLFLAKWPLVCSLFFNSLGHGKINCVIIRTIVRNTQVDLNSNLRIKYRNFSRILLKIILISQQNTSYFWSTFLIFNLRFRGSKLTKKLSTMLIWNKGRHVLAIF